MHYVLSPLRWVEKPRYRAEIDWGHPLAEALAFCCLFNDNAPQPVDLVRYGMGTLNGTPKRIRRELGLASATTDFVEWTSASVGGDSPYTGDITILWRGVITTGSAYRAFANKHASNGAANSPLEFRTDNAASPVPQLVRSSAATFSTASSTQTIPLGKAVQVAVSQQANVASGVATFYVDSGRDQGTGTQLQPTGSGATLRVGRRADGVVQMDGSVDYLYIYSRLLADDEVMALRGAPYQFLRPRERRLYVQVAAGGTPAEELRQMMLGVGA